MCGIAGIINTDSKSVPSNLIKRMTDIIAHRGPDGEGHWQEGFIALGHRRLSIIDLSPDGQQPMISYDKRYVISYNGEVYNYKEIRDNLKQKGVVFLTGSDTEVILQSFIQNGEKCVEEFVGMWAFTIFNNNDNSLFCSRDRFGIKPFYYISSGTEFYFASEIKSLKQTPIFTRNLNAK